MQSEIGSEFWVYATSGDGRPEVPEYFKWGSDSRFMATGRTALEHIICDIKAIQDVGSVYMPSYCCHTMIAPFHEHGIQVLFYDVHINKTGGLFFNIDYSKKCDILLVMNYFGFFSSETDSIISKFKIHKRTIVIEDATHSAFCERPFNPNSDYVFSSFRKWFALPGCALAAKNNSEFNISLSDNTHSLFVEMRTKAMKMKGLFFKSVCEKSSFLEMFHKAEDLLENDYAGYRADELSLRILNQIDINAFRTVRKANALQLIEQLEGSSSVKLLFDSVKLGDCPLFVPIVVLDSKRDVLRSNLISQQIYCPIHWPKSDLHKISNSATSLFENELSLVCDQRYNYEDMDRIIAAINSFK
jgi:hypothetical protein